MKHELLDPTTALLGRVRQLEQSVVDGGHDHLLVDIGRVIVAATHLEKLAQTAVAAVAPGDPPVLVSSVRHDLLNSLNQIVGFGEIIAEETIDADLQIVCAAVELLVKDARDLSQRIDALPGRIGSAAPPLASRPPVVALPQANPVRPPLTAANPILVVDDEAMNREVLSVLLRRNGLEVVEAEDGLSALAVLERQPIDLVLLDVMMPKLDGYGVLQRMNESAALQDVPVLVISSLSEIETVVRCIENGATDFVPKPFNQVLLWARIGACLEKKALRDQEQQMMQALRSTQARLAAELAEAAEYVRSLLPTPIAAEAVSIDWRFLPSTHLGGDAVGYHWIGANHLALYVIDVCGRGVGSALLAVSVTRVLRSQALRDTDFLDPAAVLADLNTAFPMDRHNGQYFTMWYGVYDAAARRIRFASGGHPPAILIPSDSGPATAISRLGGPGLVIGAMPDATFESAEADVAAGSRLFIFSNGAYEITRPDGSMLLFDDFQSMLESVAGVHDRPLDTLVAQLRALRGEDQFEDDVSVMEIYFN